MNKYGKIVEHEWLRSADIRREIELDINVIMPNHFHAIFHIIDSLSACDPLNTSKPVGAYGHTPLQQPFTQQLHSPSRSVGALVRGFKSAVTKHINILRHTPSDPVWQRNYYEHILSGDREYNQIADYIYTNPINWITDAENAQEK
ncbi:MAG: hypothetical protein FD147_1255 [Chloroflexi bacterium]|nr:MAG: hypothetical protein FD147_1255 [Chloroflexota bacterium]